MRDNRQTLQTVERAAAVLALFSPVRPQLSLAEVARDTRLPKTVAHRLCATLVRVRLLHQDPETRRYRCGTRVLELAEAVLAGVTLRSLALPYMREVQAATEESVFLNIVSGHQAVCIEAVDSSRVLRVTYGVGRHTPLYAGAPARLLLAFLTEAEQERVLSGPLVAFTGNTLTDPVAFRTLLGRIRADEWTWSIGELTPDVGAVSVPIRCGGGEVVAALSTAGPAWRYDEASQQVYLAALRAAAAGMEVPLRSMDRRVLLGI